MGSPWVWCTNSCDSSFHERKVRKERRLASHYLMFANAFAQSMCNAYETLTILQRMQNNFAQSRCNAYEHIFPGVTNNFANVKTLQTNRHVFCSCSFGYLQILMENHNIIAYEKEKSFENSHFRASFCFPSKIAVLECFFVFHYSICNFFMKLCMWIES